jgi:hypothetical protein
MIDIAKQRLGDNRVRVQRMQEISEKNTYDIVCALSWTIHYCETEAELEDVIRRCCDALLRSGLLLLQVANEEQMTDVINVDLEPSSSGEPNDTFLIHRFQPLHDKEHRVAADYVYASREHHELLFEQHELRFANASVISEVARRAGLKEVVIINPTSISPFVMGAMA